MRERVSVLVSDYFWRENVQGKEEDEVSRWLRAGMRLLMRIEQGEIFQKIGEEFVRLRVRDVQPIFDLRTRSGEEEDIYELELEIPDDLPNDIHEFKGYWPSNEWVRRAINLSVMAENLGLYFFDPAQGYVSVMDQLDTEGK